jgi:hypothetical protein
MTSSATIDRPCSDADLIASCRHRDLLVVVSIAKRWLSHDIEPEFRFRYLESFERFEQKGWLSAEAVTMIDPMCDRGIEIWTETRGLSAIERNRVMDKPEVFSVLAALNPSLLRVIRHRSETYHGWPR